jgi:hypothetical protein
MKESSMRKNGKVGVYFKGRFSEEMERLKCT